MLRLLLIFHLAIRFRQGLTQTVNMCVENSIYVYDEELILYTSGPQCTRRTCSCLISIKQSCVPVNVKLKFYTLSNDCGGCGRNMHNATIIYKENSENKTLSWIRAKNNDERTIRDVSEPVSISTTYSGCDARYYLDFSFSGLCLPLVPILTVNCQAPTERTTTTTTTTTTTRTTTRTTTTSATAEATATLKTTTVLSSTEFHVHSDSRSSSSADNNEIPSKTGMIVGIVVGVGGGLILLMVVIIIVVIIRHRRIAKAKRTPSLPNPYELPSSVSLHAANNGRDNYQPLNFPPQYETEASNYPTQSPNIHNNVGDRSQIDDYDNFRGRDNETFSSSSDATDYYNAVAAVNDDGIPVEMSPVDNNELTVIDNSLYK